MSGAVDQLDAAHGGATDALHPLDRAGRLVNAPIAAAGDEQCGHVDAAAGEHLQLAETDALSAAAIPLQTALETGSGVFGAVDSQLGLGLPAACGTFRGR